MWWYSILGDNEGSISHILRTDTITAGSILLTANLVALKRGNSKPFFIVKITEQRKFIDYFGLIIEGDQSRVRKKKIYFSNIGHIPRPSSIKLHTPRQYLDKVLNL